MEVPLLDVDASDFDKPSAELELKAYKKSTFKLVVFIILSIITLGTVYLLARWLVAVRCFLLYDEAEFGSADVVLVTERNPQVGEPGQVLQMVEHRADGNLVFVHKGLIYVYEGGRFVNHTSPIEGKSVAAVHEMAFGGGAGDALDRATIFGRNEMPVPTPSALELALDEVLSPFYIFQIASIVIWMVQLYWIYSLCIFILATAGIIMSVVQTRSNNMRLRDMAHHVSTVAVQRGSARTMVDSSSLLPGDLVYLEGATNAKLPADLVLLEGECIVNESTLTGETVPVIKAPLPKVGAEAFFFEQSHRHVLFCGTELCRTRGQSPLALVVRTGYQTSKGELVRAILYPKKMAFKFFRDAFVFIGILCASCLAFVIWSGVQFGTAGASAFVVAVRTLDLFTVLIPPALPIAITAGTTFAVHRLRQKGIYTVVPKAVAVAGRLNMFCFDKTGTLTADHLNINCVLPASGDAMKEPVTSVKNVSDPMLRFVLAGCHSVVQLGDGEMVGDPMEIKMLLWSGWKLSTYDDRDIVVTSPDTKDSLQILHRHEFSSALARMSTIVRAPSGEKLVLAKGSPKELLPRCTKGVPGNVEQTLDQFASQGMRIVALAARSLDKANMENRDEVETDLTFLGLLVMRNPVLEESYEVISRLSSAGVRCLMITGDHSLTAINVARSLAMGRSNKCFLVDRGTMQVVSGDSVSPKKPFDADEIMAQNWDVAMTGDAYQDLEGSPVLPLMLERCYVFARTNPLQKASIILAMKRQGHTVGMVGDGANDCGALRYADAGLSLSDGEAAIAAPFTASSVLSVLDIVKEGRCALATTFSLFKFMILYSAVQFAGIMICYVGLGLFSDLQFLWIDLFLILPLSFTLGLTPPSDRLDAARPPPSMLCLSSIASVAGHAVLGIVPYVLICVVWLPSYQWYVPVVGLDPVTDRWNTTSMLITTSWKMGNFLYLSYGFAFAIGYPWRGPFWWNPFLTLALFGLLACNIAWYWVDNPVVIGFFHIVLTRIDFAGPAFGVIAGVCIAIYLYEVMVIRLLLPRDSKMATVPPKAVAS